jgi:hypothetical protein
LEVCFPFFNISKAKTYFVQCKEDKTPTRAALADRAATDAMTSAGPTIDGKVSRGRTTLGAVCRTFTGAYPAPGSYQWPCWEMGCRKVDALQNGACIFSAPKAERPVMPLEYLLAPVAKASDEAQQRSYRGYLSHRHGSPGKRFGYSLEANGKHYNKGWAEAQVVYAPGSRAPACVSSNLRATMTDL